MTPALIFMMILSSSLVSGMCPHPNFLQNHVCDYCNDWKQVTSAGTHVQVPRPIIIVGARVPGLHRSQGYNISHGSTCPYFSSPFQTKWPILKVNFQIWPSNIIFFVIISVIFVSTDKPDQPTDATWMPKDHIVSKWPTDATLGTFLIME